MKHKVWFISGALVVLLLIGLLIVPTLGGGGGETNSTTYTTYEDDGGIPELERGFGIYGSSVEFDGVHPGWSGTVPLTIVNGLDKERIFNVSVVRSGNLRIGYESLPEEYFSWITIEGSPIQLGIGEVGNVLVTLTMPRESTYTGKKAELRLLVEDTTQAGLVQVAVESRWFIITAGK